MKTSAALFRKIEIERNEAREREAKMAGELHEFQSEVGHFLYTTEHNRDFPRLSAAYDRAVKALDDRDKELAFIDSRAALPPRGQEGEG